MRQNGREPVCLEYDVMSETELIKSVLFIEMIISLLFSQACHSAGDGL